MPSLPQILVGVSSSLLFTIGTIVAALTAHGVDSTSDFAGVGTSNLRGRLRGHDLSLLPEQYEKSPNWAIQTSGVIAAVTGLVGLLEVVFKVVEGGTSEAFYATLMNGTLGSLSVILSFIALVYGMISQAQSATWQYQGIKTSAGKYTVEGWACQMKDVVMEHDDEFAMVCRETKAARFLTIVLALGSITFIVGTLLREKIRRAKNRRTLKYLPEEEVRSL